jgi:hypothetical protein
MSGWVTIQDYLREIVIFLIAIILLECAFNFPLFIYFFRTPPALVLLFSAMIPIVFISLSVITMSFLTFVPSGWLRWHRHVPTKWEDVRDFSEKYKKFLIFGAEANALFFIGLAAYFLLENRQLSSESIGVLIFLFWVILNCFMWIVACLSLIFATSENTQSDMGRDWRP